MMKNSSLKRVCRDYTYLTSIPHHTTDLFLSCCGRQTCPPDYVYGPTVRMEYLIHFIVKGKGIFRLDGKQYELSKNQFFLIPPGIAAEYIADTYEPWEYIWFGFQGSQAASYLEHTGLFLHSPVGTFHMNSELIESVIEKLFEADSDSLPDELDRIGYLHRLLSLLIDSYQSSISTNRNELLLNKTHTLLAIQYLEDNYATTTVADIANYLGLNRTYLHTLFKKEFNMSPQQYLIHYKLENAAKKLLSSSDSVHEIAYQVGYRDTVSFSKAFKKQYGLSPQQYRTQQGENMPHGR